MLKLAATPATKNDTVPLGSLGYLHVVATTGPIAHKIREVEKAFWGSEGGIIGVRWLLQWNSRRRKAASPLVIFLCRLPQR